MYYPMKARLHYIAHAIVDYFVKARMTFAEICRKKMDAMKERDRTRTMKGSTRSPGESSV